MKTSTYNFNRLAILNKQKHKTLLKEISQLKKEKKSLCELIVIYNNIFTLLVAPPVSPKHSPHVTPKLNLEQQKRKQEYLQKWRKTNRQHMFQYMSKRYIKQGINLSPMDLWSLAKKQKGKCGISGKRLKGEVISIDHIIPKALGGSNDKSNLQLTILKFNKAKQDLRMEEFLNLCKTVIGANN